MGQGLAVKEGDTTDMLTAIRGRIGFIVVLQEEPLSIPEEPVLPRLTPLGRGGRSARLDEVSEERQEVVHSLRDALRFIERFRRTGAEVCDRVGKSGKLFQLRISATESSLLRSGMSSFLSRRYGLIASSILFGAHYLLAQYTIRRARPQSGSVSASQKKGTGTVAKNTVPNIKQETAKRVFTGCNYSINNGIMTVL